MKSEEKIKEAMSTIEKQLPKARGEEVPMLQGQFAALEWVLEEEKPDEG